MPERIIIVEDDDDLRTFLTEVLEDAGYEGIAFPQADAALREIGGDAAADLVVTDLILPGMRGHELLAELRMRRPELNVIIITAFGSIDSAIEMVKSGAYDYLTKPFSTDDFLLSVRRALADSRLRREVALLTRQPASAPAGFVAASRPMQELFRLLARAAQSRHPVLITGESGTGKELVARAVHATSGRGPFVAVNCAALPENLLESELFGHTQGAFTGADREKPGLFEAAHTGTLFLDEIAELPLALQPKLLRALEYGEIRRVGANAPRNLDVRVIAATNRVLEEEVGANRFREDLFWRLNVLHLHVPPLRERPADIPLLAEHFAALASQNGQAAGSVLLRISPDAMATLTAYPWPGNVRELRNAIERASTLATSQELRAEDLPARIREAGRAVALVSDASHRQLSLKDLERAYIAEVLRQTGGNKSRAAEILGLDRKTLYRKLEEG
jgi:DNA-binding NtrC family response regulator